MQETKTNLKICVFQDVVMLTGKQLLTFHGSTGPSSSVPIRPHLFLECLIPNMKALWSTATSATIHQLTRCNIFSNMTVKTSNVTKYTYSDTQWAAVNTQSTLMMEPPQKWLVVRTPWNITNIKCIHRVVQMTNTGYVCFLRFGYTIWLHNTWTKEEKTMQIGKVNCRTFK